MLIRLLLIFFFGEYRGIDFAVANNETLLKAQELPFLLKQVSCFVLLLLFPFYVFCYQLHNFIFWVIMQHPAIFKWTTRIYVKLLGFFIRQMLC